MYWYLWYKTKGSRTHAFSKKSFGMAEVFDGKVLPFQLSFQWGCNILSSIHLTLTLFTRGRIMSHFLLPFLWLCMNLLCLIILLINMPGIWHLAFQIPISIMSWQQLQIKNPNLAGLICKVHFLFHQIDWWLDHLSDSGKNERKDDKMHCSVKNQRDWHWLLYFFCWAQY